MSSSLIFPRGPGSSRPRRSPRWGWGILIFSIVPQALFSLRVMVHKSSRRAAAPAPRRGVLQVQASGVRPCRRGRRCPRAQPDLLPDAGDVHEVPGTQSKRSPAAMEGQQTPVDAVGAIALGGKLIADIGAPAQHPLAGGGLLPGRSRRRACWRRGRSRCAGVSRLTVWPRAVPGRLIQCRGVPRRPVRLQRPVAWAGDVVGVPAGQGEGGQLQGLER